MLAAEGLDRIVLKRLHLPQTEAQHGRPGRIWSIASSNPTDEITIHVVGKYVGYEDSYKSLNEALYHGGFKHRLKVNISGSRRRRSSSRTASSCSTAPTASSCRAASATAARAA